MKKLMVTTAFAAVAGLGQLNAQTFEGDVSLSVGNAPLFSTDDDEERIRESGYRLSGWLGMQFGDWRVFGDVNRFRRDIDDEDFDSYAPEGADSIGLHFGRTFGPAYAGAFLGKNRFQGEDADSTNGFLTGDLYGIEGQYDLGNVSLFGQYGRADMVGDGTDTAFTGNFGRIGISATVDKFTLTADFEKGRSPDVFEDSSGWGEYRAIGVAVDYKITDRLIASVSYENMDITANDEDNGTDEYYAIGLRIPFGASTGKRNNLTTTYRPGLAAAWAETLD